MPEKTKQNEEREKFIAEKTEEESEKKESGNWSDDQKNKSYYYDDAYGYEIYDPDADDDEAENC